MNRGAADPFAFHRREPGDFSEYSTSGIFPSVPSFQVSEMLDFDTLDKVKDKDLIEN